MKNKKFTYLLIVVVLFVWGMIIYRIADSAGGGNDPQPTYKPMKQEAFNDYAITADTGHLLLNYRDPFGVVKPPEAPELPVKDVIRKSVKPAPVKPPMNWNFIQYAGYIRNHSSNKLITVIAINGKNLALKEGETAGQVRLIKNMGDSIRITFNGQTKNIRLKSAL